MVTGVPDSTLQWLLGEDNPPVRYLTLVHLLGKTFGKSYQKSRGRFWQMIFLGQFLADGHDPRIAPGVESILVKREFIGRRGMQRLTANILGAAMRLGFSEHPLVVEETETLAERVVDEDGLTLTALRVLGHFEERQ